MKSRSVGMDEVAPLSIYNIGRGYHLRRSSLCSDRRRNNVDFALLLLLKPMRFDFPESALGVDMD